MSYPYPTLSELGLIYDPAQKVEFIFADYIAGKHSQSTMFFGQTSSISWDEFAGNYDGTQTALLMESSLTKLYKAYFDEADITATDISDDDESVKVKIVGILRDNGLYYNLNEVLQVRNGRIKKLAEFN